MARDPPALNAPKKRYWDKSSTGQSSSRYSSSKCSTSQRSSSSYSSPQDSYYSASESDSYFLGIVEQNSRASEVNSELIEEARRCIIRYREHREVERQRGMSFGEDEPDSEACPSDFFQPDWETRRIHVMPGVLSNNIQRRNPAVLQREVNCQTRSQRGRAYPERTDSHMRSMCDNIHRRWEKQNERSTGGLRPVGYTSIPNRMPRFSQPDVKTQLSSEKKTNTESYGYNSKNWKKSLDKKERRDASSDESGSNANPMLREFLNDARKYSYAKPESSSQNEDAESQRGEPIEEERDGPVEKDKGMAETNEHNEKSPDVIDSSGSREGTEDLDNAAVQNGGMVDREVEERKELKAGTEETVDQNERTDTISNNPGVEDNNESGVDDDSQETSSNEAEENNVSQEEINSQELSELEEEIVIDEDVLRELYNAGKFEDTESPGFWGTFLEFLLEITTICSPSEVTKEPAAPPKYNMPLLSIQGVEEDINGWGGGATDDESMKTNKIVRAINFSSKRLDEINAGIALYDENKLRQEVHKVQVSDERFDALEQAEEYYDECFEMRQRVPDAVIVKAVKMDEISLLENNSVADTIDDQSIHAWSLSPRRKRRLKARSRAVRGTTS